jgi:hypothetical protein
LSYITAIETAVPDHCFSQETLTSFYMNLTDDDKYKRKIKIVAGKTGIGKRYSVLKDFGAETADYDLFSRDLAVEPGLTERMMLYKL